MNIININIDNSVFDKNGNHFKRLVDYSYWANNLTVIVPDSKKEVLNTSDRLFIFGTGGKSKFSRLFNLYILAKKIISKGKYDIISAQDPYYLGLITMKLAKKFNLGFEVQVHGWEKFYGLRKKIAKYVLNRADSIRVVSNRLKQQIIREFNADEKKITVVPIHTETQFPISNLPVRQAGFQFPNKLQKKNSKDKFIFLTVGRLVPVKNIGLQIKAMAEVVKKYPNAELGIVGSGLERKNLENEAAKSGVKKNVKFFGWQDNPEKFYQQADAFLLTSNYEGWGMAVVEAAGYGLPIIMTDVGLAGEVIKNEESGLVVPINDQIKIEESMLRLIEDGELQKKLAENASAAIKKLPSKEETRALYKESWEKAIKNK